MKADNFINLDASCDSDPESENNALQNSNSIPSEALLKTCTSQIEDVGPNGDITLTIKGNDVAEEDDHMETMDLDADLVQTQHVLQDSIQFVESVGMVEEVNEVEVDHKRDGGCTVTQIECTTSNLMVDGSPISGVKRARVEEAAQEPSVRVVYSALTRESKKKLMELMQQWSEWHAKCQPPKEPSTEGVEYGEETYFPALNIGSEKSSTVSFWFDIQSSKVDVEYKPNSDSVPLYDRGCTLGSSLTDGSVISERNGGLEASRCFNCGSYNHALRECPKPRDNVAIGNARKQHNSKRNQTPGSRSVVRYYEKPSGKFDDLRAGVLGPEARESLGIGEFDPPPWLHRMREMGYPPGYLEDVEDEDQPSGITIFGDEERVEAEEGELPEEVRPKPVAKKQTVEFPGINAPIPENANTRLWTESRPGSSSQRSGRALEPLRGSYHDQRRTAEYRNDAPPPPGTEYGPPPSMSGYSPRYSPYETPVFNRSLSDRERSRMPYDSSAGHSPHSPFPYPGQHRQSPQLNSPAAAAAPEHRSHDRQYTSSPDMSHQSRDRHDHRRQHRR